VVEDVVGIEGPLYWVVGDFDAWWADSSRKEQVLAAARAVEREPSRLGIGPHLMSIARRGAT
jgi:hypothetical protein